MRLRVKTGRGAVGQRRAGGCVAQETPRGGRDTFSIQHGSFVRE